MSFQIETPEAVVQCPSDETKEFVVEESFRNALAFASHEPIKMSSTDFSKMVLKESDEWAVRLKAIKLE